MNKRDSDWRFVCININNFPSERNGIDKAKFDLLKSTLYNCEADVMGITELGRNEYEMQLKNRPSEVSKQWFEQGLALSAWNQDSNSTYEPGGTMVITRDRSSAHTVKKGIDERKLGRWVWVTVKGKQERTTTVITT